VKNPNDSFFVDRVKSMNYALKGLWILITTENSIKTHIIISISLIILGFVVKISTVEWALQLLAIALVLVTESLNTVIEKTANFIHPDFNKKIGNIKDISAGAVAFAMLFSIIVELIIYLPKFTD